MLLKNFPVLRLLIPYIFGIFTGYFTVFNVYFAYSSLFLLVFCFVFILIFKRKTSYYAQKWVGLMILFLQFFAAYLSTSLTFHQPYSSEDQPFWTTKNLKIATIIETPQKREKSIKTIVAIDDQKALLYIQNDTNALELQYGDVIIIHTYLKKIEASSNPEGFDYKTYMKRKGVVFSGYVNQNQWIGTGKNNGFWIKKVSIYSQQLLSDILAKSGLSGNEFSIAAAILLGNDDTMEPDLKAIYSNAGVSHILCVSGMHVGIIFMILNYLLIPLDWIKKMRMVKIGILFIAIWSYANLTGLSPSVVRSATMFTFVLMGTLLFRKTNIYQSLFASLFIILIVEPLLIFDLGFQLSYLAVFGIVIFQKKIEQLYIPKTKIGNYFWSLTSVSLAAQISTFPISIYYFNQFPNYFLIANLGVIFLSFCVMLAGIIVIGTTFIPDLSHFVSRLLEFLIKLMNLIIETIQKLPGAVSENISISVYQMGLLYFLISALYFTIVEKNKHGLFVVLISLLTFLIIENITQWNNKSKSEWIVFSSPKATTLLFNNGGAGIVLSDSITSCNSKSYKYSVKNYIIKNDIRPVIIELHKDTTTQIFCKKGNLIYFKGKTMLIAYKSFPINFGEIKVDYVYMNHPKIDIEKFLDQVEFETLVLDNPISRKQEEKWKGACKKRNKNIHSIREKGAFILNLE